MEAAQQIAPPQTGAEQDEPAREATVTPLRAAREAQPESPPSQALSDMTLAAHSAATDQAVQRFRLMEQEAIAQHERLVEAAGIRLGDTLHGIRQLERDYLHNTEQTRAEAEAALRKFSAIDALVRGARKQLEG